MRHLSAETLRPQGNHRLPTALQTLLVRYENDSHYMHMVVRNLGDGVYSVTVEPAWGATSYAQPLIKLV